MQPGHDEQDNTVYQVVVNHEGQYSLWFTDRELPAGWEAVGKSGAKAECLAYIEQVWTDLRPLSLRKKMDEKVPEGGSSAARPPAAG